jgi:hypothetical protein
MHNKLHNVWIFPKYYVRGHIKDEAGGSMQHAWDRREMRTKFWLGNPKGTDLKMMGE